MSTEERNKVITWQMYTELFAQGKLSLAEELFAADFIDLEAPLCSPCLRAWLELILCQSELYA